jgi:hypothetical protein
MYLQNHLSTTRFLMRISQGRKPPFKKVSRIGPALGYFYVLSFVAIGMNCYILTLFNRCAG